MGEVVLKVADSQHYWLTMRTSMYSCFQCISMRDWDAGLCALTLFDTELRRLLRAQVGRRTEVEDQPGLLNPRGGLILT